MSIGTIFVSFYHNTKPRAMWLVAALRRRGYTVVCEDDFGAGSPRSEMYQSIRTSEMMIALISEGYVDSPATRRELDIAEAHQCKIVAVFAGIPPRHEKADVLNHYRRVDLDEQWQDSDEQWSRLLVLIDGVLQTEEKRASGTLISGTGTKAGSLELDDVVLLYDLEDHEQAAALLAARPRWRSGISPDPDAIDDDLPVALLWTRASAEPYSVVQDRYRRLPNDVLRFAVVADPGDRLPAPPPGGQAVALGEFLGTARRAPQNEPTPHGSAEQRVAQLVADTVRANSDTPLDVFAERFCASARVVDLAADAYKLASDHLPSADHVRLRAVRHHALALRFTGRWTAALEVLEREIQATERVDDLDAAAAVLLGLLRLERLSVRYELGLDEPHSTVAEMPRIQRLFFGHDDLEGYVQAGRCLANVLRELGDLDRAGEILQRTIGLAEYLAQKPGDPGRLALADCHREMAALFTARRDLPHARASLASAHQTVDSAHVQTGPAYHYLSAILDLIGAKIEDADDGTPPAMTPTLQAESALTTLSMFHNPIRLASVYEWLGAAWTRQVPGEAKDMDRAAEYLHKALRVRERYGHEYPTGLSHMALGHYYARRNELDRSIEHFERGRRIFNARGLRPALAGAHAELARAYLRRSGGNPGDDFDRYQLALHDAESIFEALNRRSEALDLRYELEHSGRRPMDAADDSTPLIAVGEFTCTTGSANEPAHSAPSSSTCSRCSSMSATTAR